MRERTKTDGNVRTDRKKGIAGPSELRKGATQDLPLIHPATPHSYQGDTRDVMVIIM